MSKYSNDGLTVKERAVIKRYEKYVSIWNKTFIKVEVINKIVKLPFSNGQVSISRLSELVNNLKDSIKTYGYVSKYVSNINNRDK